MKNRILCFVVGWLGASGMLCAATYYVAPAPAGLDANDGASWLAPMATISNALAQVDVNLVLVSNGLYEISSTITNAKAATVRGVNTPGQTNTIIDGGGVHRCFLLNHTAAVLDGLLVTNGYANSGAGVLIQSGGGTITNCIVTGNRIAGSGVTHSGAGVWMYGTGAVYNTSIIGNAIVTNNASPRGGGIYMHTGPNTNYIVGGLVANCLVAHNIATNGTAYGGGGIYMLLGTVRDSVISNNTAVFGGGVTMSGGGVVTNCRVVDNISLDGGGGLYMRDFGSPGALVTDCIVSNNRTGGSGSGGGLYLTGQTTQVVRATTITHNRSINRDGGGIVILAGLGGALIDGCVIEHNRSDGTGNLGGGGVYVTRSGATPDDVQIINSTIRYNHAAKNGGGVGLYRGGVVSNCLIEGNIASTNGSYLGGGVYATQGGQVRHCQILNNNSHYRGGGVYALEGGVLFNSLIAGNVASNAGGGIYVNGMSISNGSVQSCTFVDNEGNPGGGIYVTGDNHIINTVVYSNRNSDITFNPGALPSVFHYSCTSSADLPSGQGNITNAPIFVDFGAGNFRLASGSAGINAGSNAAWMATGFDLDGKPRLDRVTGRVDMGCYEYLFKGTFFNMY